jgi:hypothetical protein
MTKLIGIDATELFCPEFTTPVLSLINRLVPTGKNAVIKTKEHRGLTRIQHICASYDWNVTGYMEKEGIFYIAITV